MGTAVKKIDAFATVLSVEEARGKALKQLGLIGKLFVKDRENFTMQTIYIENRLITFDVSHKPNILLRALKRKSGPRSFPIQMIANGSTSGVSYYDGRGASIADLEVPDDQVQLSDYTDKHFVERANLLARRILRRRVGGNISLTVRDIKSIYRVYHVAFFGELTEGQKVRYVPIPADGCSVSKTF